MKKILYISALACTALLAAACSKDQTEPNNEEGCLSLSYEFPQLTRTDIYNAESVGVLRIYNAEDQLIRRYDPATECPEYLYLIAGHYKVSYKSSDGSQATWDHISYEGEQEFDIKAHETSNIELYCPISNSAVKVTFDASIAEKMEMGFAAYVCARDQFSQVDAENGAVPTLKYTEDRTGYFLLPEGVSKLSWGFFGKLKDGGNAVTLTSTTGNREIVPEPGKLYSLNFKYSKTPDGTLENITVMVEEEGDIVERRYFFSPQPTFSGENFMITDVAGYSGSAMSINVSALSALQSISMTVNDGQTYQLCENGVAAATADGISFDRSADGYTGKIVMTSAFFDKLGGGIHNIYIEAVDKDGGKGKTTARIAVSGLLAVDSADYDLWSHRATFKAIVTDTEAANVAIEYRKSGATEWNRISAAASQSGDKYTYSAVVTPEWNSEQYTFTDVADNNREYTNTVYRLKKGIVADCAYEYRLLVNGTVTGTVQTLDTATTQTIPYGDMEDENLSCFGNSNSNSKYWGSGNNSFSKPLCIHGTKGESKCAVLQASNAAGKLASGNLFFGTFTFNLPNGTVGFGQAYNWQARPAALKLKLCAQVGKVNVGSSPLKSEAQDISSVYMAVVDWNTRHEVTSGLGTASGMWSPAKGPDAVSEGKILGFGILDIDKTTGDSMVETTIPIYWYDRESGRPAGNYTLVIACSTSKYGDYMNGCSSNIMYVDDFEWAY